MWNCKETVVEQPLSSKTAISRRFFLPFVADLDNIGSLLIVWLKMHKFSVLSSVILKSNYYVKKNTKNWPFFGNLSALFKLEQKKFFFFSIGSYSWLSSYQMGNLKLWRLLLQHTYRLVPKTTTFPPPPSFNVILMEWLFMQSKFA